MGSTPDAEVDRWGNIEQCGNPAAPSWWVSAFLTASWWLTYVLPSLLPSDKTLTWSDVMELNMGRVEGLLFTLFSTLSIEALVLYALTSEEGTKLNKFLEYLISVIIVHSLFLGFIVVYEYVIKPAIFRPTTRPQASDSVTSQNAFHLPHDKSNPINAL